MSNDRKRSRTTEWRHRKKRRCVEGCGDANCSAHHGVQLQPTGAPQQDVDLCPPSTSPGGCTPVPDALCNDDSHHSGDCDLTEESVRDSTSINLPTSSRNLHHGSPSVVTGCPDSEPNDSSSDTASEYSSSRESDTGAETDSSEGALSKSSEDEKDFVRHCLEEEPQPVVQPALQEPHADRDLPRPLPAADIDHDEHGGDQDDPDDPDEPGDANEDADEEGDEEDDDRPPFSLDGARMNVVLQFGQRDCTVRDCILLNLGLAVKHNWTYEELGASLASWSAGLGRGGVLPKSKKQLWKFLQKSDSGFVKYAYCPNCLKGHGRVNRLAQAVIQCECHTNTPREEMPYFLSVSVKKQFQSFLSSPGIAALLQYRQTRRRHRANAMEDIFDGEMYTSLIEANVITDDVLTYIINSDGFKVFKHRSMSVWGLLGRINELPPNLRQKHLFLFAIWIGPKEPNMNTFLQPFVEEANRISRDGIRWRPDGGNEKVTKFIPIGLSVDAVARAMCLNQMQFNGHHGCYSCTHEGIFLDGSMKYPLLPYEDLPPAAERTHESIVASMHLNVLHLGQKGPSVLMLLDHFDLAKGNCMDDLHPFYEGIAAFHLELLLGILGEQQAAALRVINRRMGTVRTPLQMARKWLSILKRLSWKGSQWGYFCRYFAPLCFLNNQLPVHHLEHVSMFSYCTFVWSQDSVDPADLNRAGEYAELYLRRFQEYHGAENMRFNVHMAMHATQARRRWGPSWTCSTFNFESMNRKLGLRVTSSKGANDQIVTRHLLHLFTHAAVHRPDVSEGVRNHLSDMLFGTHRQIAEDIDDEVSVLGRGSPRAATPEEQALLQRNGVNAARLTEYDRLLLRGIEFRCRAYHENTKSDNSVVYTWNNAFATINKIVVVERDGIQTCGLFIEQHHVDHPIRYAHHIARVTGHSLQFIAASVLRVPAIKICVQGTQYVVPMASCHEID